MSSATATGNAHKLSSEHPSHHFSLAEIQSATNDFDDHLVIGKGGFGKVYKARVFIQETSHVVAIKRLDSMSDQGAPEFRAEIEMLSKLRHCHLVSLIGYCDENKEMILVYEYMPHGTLYHHLHKADTPLNWLQRLKIAIGAARGLDYLHTGVGTHLGVIHRDVKSSNILLDENWAPKISDFGLSKLGPTNQSSSYVDASVKGTFGYLDPEYFYTRRLTRRTDVFAFGVVLLELLSGRLPVDMLLDEDECSLVRWGQKCVKDGKVDQMVDSNMKGTIFPKCLRQFARLAYRCLHSVPKERPSMTEVVASLHALLELQEKFEVSAASPSVFGFTWKIPKYLVSTTKQNSDQSGSSQKSLENHMNQLAINKEGSDHGEMLHHSGELVATDLKKFTYGELHYATRNFGNDACLGDGSYAKVYKGWVDKTTSSPSKDNTGLPIAVKRLHHHKHLDLEMLKEFSHPNLVKLLGYCWEGEQLFLVYEFMPNGNYQDALHSGVIAQLPLVTKVKIAVGIARGLVFLHKTQDDYISSNEDEDEDEDEDEYHFYYPWSDPFQAHGKFSAAYPWTQTISESRLDRHKILLDEDFTIKLSDYDVTKFLRGEYPQNTSGNFDDYYPGFEPFQLQSNLSGFTVVFAEVLTGRKICNLKEFWEIDGFLRHCGKMSLRFIANLCFKICNEVDSDSQMVTILEGYEKHITAMRHS